MKKILAISIVMIAFAASAFAQVTANATATATIVTPITITNAGTNLSFGNVIPSATLAGTVVVSPAGAPTYTDVTASALPVATATVSAAAFNVTGTPSATYSITLPSADVTLTGPSGTMIVNTFTSSPTPTGTLSSPGGAQTLTVGATLNVGIAQAAGTYTSLTPFDVTVNYN
ncbi:MAG: DUF4402 domain-containing protein [Bacteroidales bacterium]|nr:DUF4402 domain-containing protein [Bacteroidales bacterium]TFH50255.1 MAG: DUF4402 domain-containing protein [Bacteroidia bacterium]